MKDAHRYDDIMGLPHHVSAKRQRMSNGDRAAQFAPFAALTGYEAVIQETGRLTDVQTELDECSKALLNEKLRRISDAVSARPLITFTCFRPDARKTGGSYLQITGRVKKIAETEAEIILTDGTAIPIAAVYGIEGELFG